jgi:hypothetical protein
MDAAILKILLVLVLLSFVLAGCQEQAMSKAPCPNREIVGWQSTPAGVPVPIY